MPEVQPIPTDSPRVMPYLFIDGATDAIEFYKSVLGAEERMRMEAPGGKVGHAELKLGESVVMMADEFPDMGAIGPKNVGGTSVMLHVYVEDVDAVFASALASGAKQLQEVKNEFYGDRIGTFEDPWGHRWSVASHVEDVPPEEMQRRMEKATAEMS
ncbi:VOC family protein [Glycomyces buryatensis]|uniref:VOC family protein n=1 Tax=Glycomyces buryatensis TaxID=2570927 RepID=A0A4S8QBP6_9ACTN|nr:VOC family protein [Glycomyces buryatensis]THV41700.1 VOC family protein [Glycomyces buryatensis]